jgi:hypothetical protein
MPGPRTEEQKFTNLVAHATVTMPMGLYEKLMKNATLGEEVKNLKITNNQHLKSQGRAMVREKALIEEVAELKRQLNMLSGDL